MNLNSDLDVDELRERFSADRRISIKNVLVEEDALALRRAIEAEDHRNLVFFANGRHFDIDAKGWKSFDELKRQTTEKIIHAQAQGGFSYYYENIPVFDRWRAGRELSPVLRDAVEFLNGETFLSFVRRVTGRDEISFSDAQATLYGPGHFLTLHDDAIAGKHRSAAYVLNLTPNWREDWGGYLNFFNADGHVDGAFKPAFNALNIFSVPAVHSVGHVAPFAGALRCSITGWLRCGEPEQLHA
jgi:Rps23 Pro-64 3,4-dihydroxylase Tpa1-like proline 4-hydroxylase